MPDDFDKVKKLIDQAANIAREKKTLDAIGKRAVKQIMKRTRVGRGVDEEGGPLTKLKIKQTTKKTRRSLKKKGKLSSKTQPAKANLTRTGSMLNSLHHRVDRTDTSITITVSPKNRKKVIELDELGHKFLNLSKGEIKGLVEFLFKRILKAIK